jgi:hypothetical protein
MRYLVVARFNEPIAWVAQHRGIWNVQVVEKGVDLPNVGREASSYLWWILQNYERLKQGDRIAFVQGNPYDHCPQFDTYLRSAVMLGPMLTCDAQGWPNHGGLAKSLARGCEILGRQVPEEITFVAGAQFVVTASQIHDRTLQQYQALYDWTMEDADAPWSCERLWSEIFFNP